MPITDLMSMTIADAAAAIRSRQLSPVELTQACLDQVERHDGKINAFLTVLGDEALAAARRAEQEIVRGGDRGAHARHPVRRQGYLQFQGSAHHHRVKRLQGQRPGP